MATKRMFDKAIIETDSFLDLPISAKAMYFFLGMEADDRGFVSPKRIMRVYGGSDDDIKVLVAKNYIIPFESGVVVITHWHQNNWLDSRRTKETQYTLEKNSLTLTANNKYVLSKRLARIEENRIEENTEELSEEERKRKLKEIKNNLMESFSK